MADWYFRNQKSKLAPCPGCRNLVRKNEEYCPFCARRLRSRKGIRELYKKLLSKPFAGTHFLLGLMAAVFLLQFVVEMLLPPEYRDRGGHGLFSLLSVSGNAYTLMGSNNTPGVIGLHQYWRLITACFLHMGAIHILFNGWALWDLGRLAERLWGPGQLLATFVFTGIGGSIARTVMNLLFGTNVPSVGASGAVCGVLGLMLGTHFRNRYHLGEQLGAFIIRWALTIVVYGLVFTGIDNAAHIGGMITGAAIGYFLPPTNHGKNPGRDKRIWDWATLAGLVILVVSFAFAAQFCVAGLMALRR